MQMMKEIYDEMAKMNAKHTVSSCFLCSCKFSLMLFSDLCAISKASS